MTSSCLFGAWERGGARLNLRGLGTGAGGPRTRGQGPEARDQKPDAKGQRPGARARGQRQGPEARGIGGQGWDQGQEVKNKDQRPEAGDQSPRPKRARRMFQLFEQLDDIITRYIDPYWADRGRKTRGGEHGPREPLDRI